jgi:hypothetical protein
MDDARYHLAEVGRKANYDSECTDCHKDIQIEMRFPAEYPGRRGIFKTGPKNRVRDSFKQFENLISFLARTTSGGSMRPRKTRLA